MKSDCSYYVVHNDTVEINVALPEADRRHPEHHLEYLTASWIPVPSSRLTTAQLPNKPTHTNHTLRYKTISAAKICYAMHVASCMCRCTGVFALSLSVTTGRLPVGWCGPRSPLSVVVTKHSDHFQSVKLWSIIRMVTSTKSFIKATSCGIGYVLQCMCCPKINY